VLVFSLGALPPFALGFLFFHLVSFTIWWHYLLVPFILYIGAMIFFVSELFLSGALIAIFNITYKPGTYSYAPLDTNAFKWLIICVLYTPMRRLLEIFPVGRVKTMYYRLLGMKIGQNTLVGGAMQDPCMISIGSNTTVGEYVVIYGHIHNVKEGTILIAPVSIGNNCIIGAGVIIMPGAVIQDDVTVAAGAVVTQRQVLQNGKSYAGIPAKDLKKKRRSSKRK